MTATSPTAPVRLPPRLRLPDGLELVTHDWPVPAPQVARGTVLVVHGLGEHGGRYARLAAQLNAERWHVMGYDQRGFGASPGERGVIPSAEALLDDLGLVISAAQQVAPRPLVLLGHSMGGAVAAGFVARHVEARRQPVHALVLSSPALAAKLSTADKLKLGVGEKVAPNLAVGSGLDASKISHDEQVVKAYQKDPLVHDRISPRLARMILKAGEAVRAAAPKWKLPTLLLYSGDDHLVDSNGSRDFRKAVPERLIQYQRYDALYHEIFNELSDEPQHRLIRWLDQFQQSLHQQSLAMLASKLQAEDASVDFRL
jgi:alpha-beta hydrolase superfamily lysophospholipase